MTDPDLQPLAIVRMILSAYDAGLQQGRDEAALLQAQVDLEGPPQDLLRRYQETVEENAALRAELAKLEVSNLALRLERNAATEYIEQLAQRQAPIANVYVYRDEHSIVLRTVRVNTTGDEQELFGMWVLHDGNDGYVIPLR